MPQIVEITITAAVPVDKPDLAHEAIFLTREPVHALAVQLQEMGLVDVAHTRRLINSKRVERKISAPVVVKPAA